MLLVNVLLIETLKRGAKFTILDMEDGALRARFSARDRDTLMDLPSELRAELVRRLALMADLTPAKAGDTGTLLLKVGSNVDARFTIEIFRGGDGELSARIHVEESNLKPLRTAELFSYST